MERENKQHWQFGLLASIAAVLLLSASVSTFAQEKQSAPADKPATKQKEKPPISKQELLTVLQSGGIAPERLLALVKERGVDFQSSITDEAELGKAGAAPELVEAVGANYRPHKKSFAEKFNAAVGKSNGATSATQTNTTVRDATQDATLNSPATPSDAANTVAPPAGGTNPPAQNLGESVKQLKDAIKQLRKKKPPKPDANATTQSTQPTTTPDPRPETPGTKPPTDSP